MKFFLVAGLALAAALAHSAQLPKGSYRDSCTDCKVTGDKLECLCGQAKTSAKVKTDARISECAAGTFSNFDGKLWCDLPDALPGSDPLPRGSFTGHCHSCMFKNDLLSCLCHDVPRGELKPATYRDVSKCKMTILYTDRRLACGN